jgi:chromosome partitioning protein
MLSEMRILVIASQKGGSGKTTLSGHLGVEAERAGHGPVALIDTDPQGSLAQWWNAREAETPAFVQSSSLTLREDLVALREQGFKLIVIDTPPAATEEISEVAAFADLVILPTRPSPHDLRAVGTTIDLLEQRGKAMVFVLNSATARARITGEAAVALSQHGTVAPVTIHHRVNFASSMIDGRTVAEIDDDSPAATEITALWSYLAGRLDRRHMVALPEGVEHPPMPAPARPYPVADESAQPSLTFGRRGRNELHPT